MNSSHTSELSVNVTVQYGWSVPPWLSLEFSNRRYFRCEVSHPAMVLDLPVG